MTQASLSPDLEGVLGARTPLSESQARTDGSSETSLWMIALTSSSLVGAAILLLSLLAGGLAPDASLGGFVSGIAVMIATLGMGALAYTLVIARREGLLGLEGRASTGRTEAIPAGMHEVPALPPDLGLRKRRAQEAERAARSQQARAIAAAAAAQPQAPPAVKQQAVPGPMPPTGGRDAAPPPPAAVRVARPARPLQPPLIRMPRLQAQQARPAPWPTAAPAGMPAPSPMPRTQAALLQVRAAHVRPPVPYRHR